MSVIGNVLVNPKLFKVNEREKEKQYAARVVQEKNSNNFCAEKSFYLTMHTSEEISCFKPISYQCGIWYVAKFQQILYSNNFKQ